MNKAAGAAVAVVVLAAALGGGYWFGTQKAGQAPKASVAAPQGAGKADAPTTAISVLAETVGSAAWPQTITAVGSLRSDESVTLRPEVAGRIGAIGFQEGQRVAKGALLVALDPAVPQAETEQARANLKLAKTKYDRAVDLAKSNFISSQAKDEAENNLRIAEAALALAEAKLAKMQIRAPFSGIIGLRVVSLGDYVKEGADLVNLESIDPLKVDFRVPEVFMRQVQVGQALEVQLDALPNRTFEGRVLAVNPLIDAAGRAVVVRAVVRNPDTTLRPGMFARVRLITRESRDALVLPEQALIPQGDAQFVYRVVEEKAVRTRVEVGQRREGKVEILNGLGKDDVVITAGQLKLRDGAPVAIAAGRPTGGAKSSAAAPAGSGSPPPAKSGSSAPAAAPAKADASAPPAPRKS